MTQAINEFTKFIFFRQVDECGVHFFDPLYYEETEPFHANLRMVTNIYNNQRIKLVPAFFKKYRNQFQYKVKTKQKLVYILKY